MPLSLSRSLALRATPVAAGCMTLALVGYSTNTLGYVDPELVPDTYRDPQWVIDTGPEESDPWGLSEPPLAMSSSSSTFPHPLASADAVALIPWVMTNLGAATVADALYHIEYFSEVRSIPGDSGTRMSARVARRTGTTPSTGTPTFSYHEMAFGIAADWLNGITAPPATVDVWFTTKFLDANPYPDVMSAVLLDIAEGDITTTADLKTSQDNARAARLAAGDTYLSPILAWVVTNGGVVVESVPFAGTARVQIDSALLDDLLGLSAVTSVAAHTVAEEDCDPVAGSTAQFDGIEVSEIIQADQFYADGVHGSGVRYGLSEPGAAKVFRAHPGFDSPLIGQRYRNCQHAACTNGNPTGINQGSAHATGAASLLLGDITLGQDANYTAGSPEAEKRSGVARRATALGVSSDFTSFSINRFLSPNQDIQIVTRSASEFLEDTACTGATPLSVTWESMYYGGLALFNSTGNNGDRAAPDNCLTGSPAAAIGVFSVSQGFLTQNNNFRPSGLASTGGTSLEGRSRSIIDMLGPEPMRNPYAHYNGPVGPYGATTIYRADWSNDGNVGVDDADTDSVVGVLETGAMNASSAATPIVAGFAGLFREWHIAEVGLQILDPAQLYTNILLMGDRRGENGGLIGSGWDGVSGGGALRGRKWDAEGMDDPSMWLTTTVCVSQGQNVDIPLYPTVGGNPGVNSTNKFIPAGVDHVKVVAWYDDYLFSQSVTKILDDVSLEIHAETVEATTLPASAVPERADNDLDNKRRVFFPEVSGKALWVRLKGGVIGSFPTAECGFRLNTTVVHVAAVWEDDARDDPEFSAVCVREETP